MDSTERWSKRPHSTITQRNVDKELQRIKSLAVVSVLNKSFDKNSITPSRTTSLAPVLSPSSSLTTDNQSQENFSPSNVSDYPLKKGSNASLHSEYNQSTTSSRRRSDVHMLVTSGQGFFSNEQTVTAEKESNEDALVISSPVDTEKESLEKRVHELQELYNASIRELQEVEARNDIQKELVMIQDKLIQNMSDHLESLTTERNDTEENNSDTIQLDTEEGKQALHTAQEELQLVRNELFEFRELKTHYETIIADMSQQLSAYDAKMDEMEKIAKDIQKENAAQVEFIDTKVQTLVSKLLETNETINRLQVEQIQEKQQQEKQQQVLKDKHDSINNNSSIKSLNDSSSVIWETFEEENGGADSTRSSFISTSSQHRKSFIARWKGSAIPPASPPPSLPLPPIPSTSSRSNRPRSTLSEIYASNAMMITPQNKHISMDAVGGGRRRPSSQSEIDVEITDAAYYKEFTDQLQERLSVSKEIDDLRVWEPSDYNAIQKKIDSKNWSGSEDGNSQKDQSAFWKGMKKKLRV